MAANESARIGFVGGGGCARMALTRLQAAIRNGACARLQAAVPIGEPNRFSHCCAVSDCWQDVVAAPDIDGIVVAAPLASRGAVTLAALEAGKDLYVMPPIAPVISEAKAIRDVAARTGSLVQLGAERCAEPVWKSARERIARAELGAIRHCAIRYGLRPGGAILESLCDALAPMVCVTSAGLPQRVVSVGGRLDGDICKEPEMLTLTASYGGEPRTIIATSRKEPGLQAAIHGHDDSIEIACREGNGHSLMTEWIDAIGSRKRCTCDAALAVNTLAIAEAALEANVRGRAICPAA